MRSIKHKMKKEVALDAFKCLYEEAGVLYLNPGSIGKPRDDGPGYAIINETGIVLFDAAKLTPIKRLSFAR